MRRVERAAALVADLVDLPQRVPAAGPYLQGLLIGAVLRASRAAGSQAGGQIIQKFGAFHRLPALDVIDVVQAFGRKLGEEVQILLLQGGAYTGNNRVGVL